MAGHWQKTLTLWLRRTPVALFEPGAGGGQWPLATIDLTPGAPWELVP
jgi:hypothetical protein